MVGEMKIKLSLTNIILILIILLAAGLRFYRLASVPASVNWDEAAIGWNAKTIFFTRRDEYGTRLPLAFKSFGDYKAPLYIYLTAPVVGIFGLNVITTRLLSVLAGIGSVSLIYFIVRKLFQSQRLALVSGLFMAVSPWSFFLSRGAFEQNLALFFILLGTWFFLKAFKKPQYFLFSVLSFCFSLYTYHSPKIFLPFFLPGLVIIFGCQILKPRLKLWFVMASLVGFISVLPLAKAMIYANASFRFQGTSIFYIQEGERRPFDSSLLLQLFKNYLTHYSPSFLFLGGAENFRVQMKEVGPLLLIEAPFLVIGFLWLLKHHQETGAKIILYWLAVGPVAAVVGKEVPHHIRAFNLAPPLFIGTALGVQMSYRWFKKQSKNIFIFASLIFSTLFIINLVYFLNSYFSVYPIYSAPDWQYGYQTVAQFSQQLEAQADKIVITSQYGQPHIFILFYQDRSPLSVFQGAMIKYVYRRLNWEQDKELANVYLIASPQEFPSEARNFVKNINFPDGRTAFRIFKTSGDHKIKEIGL
jgi:4-amino-4-deoxy-L-arabinose transferase-like glycosyltransferase